MLRSAPNNMDSKCQVVFIGLFVFFFFLTPEMVTKDTYSGEDQENNNNETGTPTKGGRTEGHFLDGTISKADLTKSGRNGFFDSISIENNPKIGNIMNKDHGEVIMGENGVLMNTCSAFGSCKTEHLTNCFCDRHCSVFGDCCTDYNSSDSVDVHKMAEYPFRIEDHKCVNNLIKHALFLGVWVINTCVSSSDFEYNRIMVEKCTQTQNYPDDIFGLLLVSSHEGYVFKNKYCALCSGITDYRFWYLQIYADYSISSQCLEARDDIIQQKSIQLSVLIKNMLLRCTQSYFFDMFDVQKPRFCMNPPANKTQCSNNHLNPVKGYKQNIYRNFECCRGYEDKNCQNNKYICVSLQNLYKSRILADRQSALYGSLGITMQPTTIEDLVYDNCSFNITNETDCSGHQCIHSTDVDPLCGVNALFEGLLSKYTVVGETDSLMDIPYFYRAAKAFMYYVNKAQTTLQIDLNANRNFITIPKNSKSKILVYIRYKVFLRYPSSLFTIGYMKSWLHKLQFLYKEETPYCDYCTGKEIVFFKSKYGKSNFTPSKLVFFVKNGIVRFLNESTGAPKHVIINHRLNFKPIPNEMCHRISIVMEKTREPSNNMSIFTMVGYSCKSHGLSLSQDLYDTTVEGYLTQICLGISCICIVPCIILQINSASFKSTAGKNMLHVLIMIFLSQALFIFGIGESSITLLCLVIGISLHFLFLSSISWLSVSLLYITCSLIKMKIYPGRKRTSNWKGTLCCLTLGYFFPLLVVGTSALNDILGLSELTVGYTEDNICFPSSYPGNLIVFTGPLAFCLTINLICLIISIYIVYESSATINMVKNHHRSNLLVYSKLFCISGLSWAFGYAAEITGSVVLRYCFIVFTGLQGVFLFFAFFFKKLWSFRGFNSSSDS